MHSRTTHVYRDTDWWSHSAQTFPPLHIGKTLGNARLERRGKRQRRCEPTADRKERKKTSGRKGRQETTPCIRQESVRRRHSYTRQVKTQKVTTSIAQEGASEDRHQTGRSVRRRQEGASEDGRKEREKTTHSKAAS